MDVAAFVAARDRILTAEQSELDLDRLVRELLGALHQVTPFDRGMVLLTDPDTLLPFGGVVERLDSSDCVPFWDNELLDPDFIKFTDLARSTDPVATLADATDGDLERSPRYRKLWAPAGDELRAAFRSGDQCWAIADLLRPAELGHFPADEVAAVRELVPIAARAARAGVMRRDSVQAASAPAVVIVDPDGRLESTTPDARALLEEFPMEGLDLEMPPLVLASARRAKSSRRTAQVTVRARGTSGRWFRVHASPLGNDGRVAVVIELAPPSDLIPMVLASYGLTAREAEVVPLVARGYSTKQIAAEMCISRHTVNDHMKLIFDKCGVTSRGELVAKLFTENVLDAHRSVTGYA